MGSFEKLAELVRGSIPEDYLPKESDKTATAMSHQDKTQNSTSECSQQQGQVPVYKQDTQMGYPYMPPQCYGQPLNPGNNASDVNGNLASAFSNVNIHGHRPNYIPVKGSIPTTSGVNGDVPGMHLSQHGPFVVVSSPPMFQGNVPHAPHVGQMPPEQGGAFQYVPPGIYPNFVTSAPYPPASYPGYSWPYAVNPDHDHAKSHRDCTLVDEKASANDGQHGQPEYYPVIAQGDRSPVSAPVYNASPQTPGSCMPYQMMRAAGGYVLQDLDSLVKQDPPIPPAVPAMWTNPTELTLAKCLENREGITNVYIRGFLPEITDEMLYAYASRFGKIDRCKAIVDLDTGLCKGFGFVQFFSFEACENCIRGFFHLGYQASFAQKSRNSRLKDLEDKTSTNIYCTNVPIEWVEADLRRHFEPYRVVSEKISREENTGISKEVGFARFETRDIAEKVLAEFHNVTSKDGVKLMLRFADTKAQKQLKHQSNERRAYRAGEYSYSVEMVQGSTPSPSLHRLQQAASHFSPNSQGSYPSPAGVGQVWTPATSISPPGPMLNRSVNSMRVSSWPGRAVLANIDNTPSARGRLVASSQGSLSAGSTKTVMPVPSLQGSKSENCSPKKGKSMVDVNSPTPSAKEIRFSTPQIL
ncbi:RNA binding protein MSSP-2 [Coccidioides immitis RS]|uniref:RNA binding protein MSSP-2 n=2 Tax=Coccidioides immitis TaxID=5501 RepID=A0A0D8JTQ6_COCIM|nr:RNA binding protein MSSP-2 [Coccidioides immitis RS]KJF60351.1 RNA binding protein MSSP-2 [Coccidioides immitis RS]TPX26813.1 hypothetical protein DIZ76_012276 [Coccidioides immitis]